jgi:hypothetical protein
MPSLVGIICFNIFNLEIPRGTYGDEGKWSFKKWILNIFVLLKLKLNSLLHQFSQLSPLALIPIHSLPMSKQGPETLKIALDIERVFVL